MRKSRFTEEQITACAVTRNDVTGGLQRIRRKPSALMTSNGSGARVSAMRSFNSCRAHADAGSKRPRIHRLSIRRRKRTGDLMGPSEASLSERSQPLFDKPRSALASQGRRVGSEVRSDTRSRVRANFGIGTPKIKRLASVTQIAKFAPRPFRKLQQISRSSH